MISSPNRFKEWFNKPRPESASLPSNWRKLDDNDPFSKLLIIRALRPDRMTSALLTYVEQTLPSGKEYTQCDASNSFFKVLSLSYDDSTATTPIFFILSSGADPMGTLEQFAKQKGMYENKFHRIALGEGQDIVAMRKLEIGHKDGHWVVLENVHLMPKWCEVLEKKLYDFENEGSHQEFRVFLSAEPSLGIPNGILERSIKLTNEPPQGINQNLKRAFATFDKEEFEFKDGKIKSILFVLCHFHAIIIERKKFGSKGWNAMYPFNTGDLLNSATVLNNYLERSGNDKLPWSDLRYIFGEILYGGHITDDWDRLLCMTYLNFYLRDELMEEMELFPFNESHAEESFHSPPPMGYDQYFEYMDSDLKVESPVAFGMHPNAEIAVRTEECNALFSLIMDLNPTGAVSTEEGDGDGDGGVQKVVDDIMERVKDIAYNLEELASSVAGERGPYQNVFIQECERMNALCFEIMRSLKELTLGILGELQMSETMEKLQISLFLNRVPPSWARLAYPSLRPLAGWLENLTLRNEQLQSWTEDPQNIPMVTHLPHFFNPQSFLTAIMQCTAQADSLELDKLAILTEVTTKSLEQTDAPARSGALIAGLALEGAGWDIKQKVMDEALPRQLFCPMPVIHARAILASQMEKQGIYMCPVYKTLQRGPTFVFTATLKTKYPPEKWILAGVIMVLETGEE